MPLLPYKHTPILDLNDHPVVVRAGVRLLIKREDLNHPTISGNKWWKLKYNLEQAAFASHRTVLTFGGAYSNHIYATAAGCSELNLRSIGIIRGEEHRPLNHTLEFAERSGMDLHYIERSIYRKKNSDHVLMDFKRRFGDFMVIPEGGTNLLAVKGCVEFAEEQLAPVDFDHVFLAVGTGGTMAGLICGFKGRRSIIGVPVLREGDFLYDEIKRLVRDFSLREFSNWSLLTNYHHGGYARTTQQLDHFISQIRRSYQLPLDHVYTAKVLWAVLDQVEKGAFKRGDTIILVHTGGLQGAATAQQPLHLR